ncbi:MAG: serine/threonine protein phosphatase [Erysipelotrichaceae bacterium]|nr:serine/threonine protein phosphatase [Erysipelotrichaceae bacterium]
MLGNCEWALSAMLSLPELASQIPIYLKRISSNGAIRNVYHRLELDRHPDTLLGNQKQIYTYLKDEITYINQLPATLKFNQFLFAHAGIEKRLDYQNSSLSSLLEMQDFYHKGHILDEIVIVGHIPTSNYKQTIDNSIILDLDNKIICIDGGTGVKCLSQLNALIIENKNNKITYQQEYVQPLPIYQITQDIISQHQENHKISYPYFEVSILQKDNQFSFCYQKETNQKLWIKNEFLYMRNNNIYCLDDYTDHMLSIKKDETVKLIGVYDEYAYVIYHNHVGWIKYQYLKSINND